MAQPKKATVEEIKKLEGKKSQESMEIDQHMIHLFTECIGDPNPVWKKGVVPPGFVTTAMVSGGAMVLGIPIPFPRSVAAGADWEFFKPLKAGDTLQTTHEFFELQDKSSDKGPRALMVYKSTHKNQKGELIAVSTNSIMSY
jgi:hydroxyacyl-ACP dehydratase HTD2-like protein with hotdog domain